MISENFSRATARTVQLFHNLVEWLRNVFNRSSRPVVKPVRANDETNLQAYHRSLDYSRKWFSEQLPQVGKAFEILDQGYGRLGAALQTGRDLNNKTHVGLVPLLLILQRQSFVAYDALSSMQAYQAWVLARPGIEAALIMGKWVEDLSNYTVWMARNTDPDTYSKRYRGRKMASRSLPRSDRIQPALARINDVFVHPNPFYVFRHLGIEEQSDQGVEVTIRFFDDESFHFASVLALLHLLITTQESIAMMFSRLFVNIQVDPEQFGAKHFRELHRDQAQEIVDKSPDLRDLMFTVGLWDLAGVQRSK